MVASCQKLVSDKASTMSQWDKRTNEIMNDLILIGGRNLVKNSGFDNTAVGDGSRGHGWSNVQLYYQDSVLSPKALGIRRISDYANADAWYLMPAILPTVGGAYTLSLSLSVDVVAGLKAMAGICVQETNSPWRSVGYIDTVLPEGLGNWWHRYNVSFIWPGTGHRHCC